MNDYKRLVSYIYAYPGGVRDKNVGFAKAEVRGGMFRLSVSLKGVYTDVPKTYGVYIMVSGSDEMSEKYILNRLGNVIVSRGIGNYSDLLNPDHINNTEYTFADIKGIAVADENDRYYQMFSLWEDGVVDVKQIEFAHAIEKTRSEQKAREETEKPHSEPEHRKSEQSDLEKSGYEQPEPEKPKSKPVSEEVTAPAKTVNAQPESEQNSLEQSEEVEVHEQKEDARNENVQNEPVQIKKEQDKMQEQSGNNQPEPSAQEQVKAASAEAFVYDPVVSGQNAEQRFNVVNSQDKQFEKLFERRERIDAFDDDYYYDCVEVPAEELKDLKLEDEGIVNNSFLLHGYYNYKHILFGRVRPNDNGTTYFIGVPGMYCNRERFMASMYGFNNFKKSCRAEYSNPYFGYWYREI